MPIKKEESKVLIDFQIPDNLSTEHATNLVVQHGEHQFIIYFFEAIPPLMVGASDPIPKSLPAKCVARIVVSADRMEEFVDVLNKNFEKYKSRFQKIDDKKDVKESGD